MNTRRTLVAVISLAVLISAVQLYAEDNKAVENSLKAKEQAGWQAWKDKDAKTFGELIPDDAVNIVGGMMERGKPQIMKDLSSGACTVNSFTLSVASGVLTVKT